MERKNWLWAMAGMGLLMPGLAQALGLGSLQVLSAPGEPFRAEIPIQSVTPQTASSLNASLAPDSAFAMINLPQAPTLEHWQFTVRRGSQPAILISSPLPVSQPNLQFLVQLNWSGGQLVREYSASVANSAAAMPLVSRSAPVAPSAISPVSMPATEPVARTPAAARLYHGWSRVNRYGPVPVNSSLYDIAQSITNSNAVTLDQVMSALVKANPQAFKNANPTYLYAGSMLNLPNVNQVQAMAPAQATAWLSTQSQTGRAAPLPAAQTSGAAASTAKAQPQKASTSPTESATHLVLSSAPANAVAASADTASATRSPLAADTLALQTENQKLKGEVTGLGQRLSAEERLLDNQGAQLATLTRNSANSSLLNNIPLLISLGGNLLLLILFLWMLRRQKESERRQREVSQRLSTLNSTKSKAVAEPPVAVPAMEVAFPADEKYRLLQHIDEQFRLMDADHLPAEPATGEVESASHKSILAPEAPKVEASSAEDTLPFSFGLSPFEEEQAPVVLAKEPDPEPEAVREIPKPSMVEEMSPAAEDWDAVGTKLDLAKAYIEIGDSESARDLLDEVSKEGTSTQREEAQKILEEF